MFQSIITYNLALFDALGFETLAKNPGIRIPTSRETRRDAIIEQLKKPKNTADILCLQEVHVRSYIYQDVFVLKHINLYMCLYDQTFSSNRINMHRFLVRIDLEAAPFSYILLRLFGAQGSPSSGSLLNL